jgi:hypothetical protein
LIPTIEGGDQSHGRAVSLEQHRRHLIRTQARDGAMVRQIDEPRPRRAQHVHVYLPATRTAWTRPRSLVVCRPLDAIKMSSLKRPGFATAASGSLAAIKRARTGPPRSHWLAGDEYSMADIITLP